MILMMILCWLCMISGMSRMLYVHKYVYRIDLCHIEMVAWNTIREDDDDSFRDTDSLVV